MCDGGLLNNEIVGLSKSLLDYDARVPAVLDGDVTQYWRDIFIKYKSISFHRLEDNVAHFNHIRRHDDAVLFNMTKSDISHGCL